MIARTHLLPQVIVCVKVSIGFHLAVTLIMLEYFS